MSQQTEDLWSALIEANKRTDALIARCVQAIEPTQPISREVPFFTSIEAKFDNIPENFNTLASPNSDALEGNNVKRTSINNGSSRMYVREIGFQASYAKEHAVVTSGFTHVHQERIPQGKKAFLIATGIEFSLNWRWNFLTSITQRQYATKRVLASAGGRSLAGNHLAFMEPLIIEPRETFIFECELLSGGMNSGNGAPSAIISMILSGYREGT